MTHGPVKLLSQPQDCAAAKASLPADQMLRDMGGNFY